MKTAIILHGICDKEEYLNMDFPAPSNAHWLPWLQQKFLRDGVLCQCLEMPKPYQPKYEEWRNLFEKFVCKNLYAVVGHSAGCGFILKWLHENPKTQLDKLILVAPYIDPNREQGDFLKFDFKDDALKNVREIHLFISDDDDKSILESTKQILNVYPQIIVHKYRGVGHFCFSDVGASFEDFWKVCN
ncbi:MAG: alpha/beta hydrolase [Firmicutes bacterium]|nr:alpha/beta hydrolase [Bacillota bacterium]